MSITGKGIDPIDFDSQGNQLTDKMREKLAKCKAGDKVFFEYIKARMDKGDPSIRALSPMSFVIQ